MAEVIDLTFDGPGPRAWWTVAQSPHSALEQKKRNVIEIDLYSSDEECERHSTATKTLGRHSGPAAGSIHAVPALLHLSAASKECGGVDHPLNRAVAPSKRQRTAQHGLDGAPGSAHEMLYRLHQERQARQRLLQHDAAPVLAASVGHLPRQHAAGKGAGEGLEHLAAGQPMSGPVSMAAAACVAVSEVSAPLAGQSCGITILTLNLWGVKMRKDVYPKRMQALISLIIDKQPDVLLFQEANSMYLDLLQAESGGQLREVYNFTDYDQMAKYNYFTTFAWKRKTLQPLQQGVLPWESYKLERVPFIYYDMGRDVAWLPLSVVGNPSAPPLLVATSHLESPCGRAKRLRFVEQRELQMEEAFEILTDRAEEMAARLPWTLQGARAPCVDIVWGGDMNWISDHRREPELPDDQWQDVWATHRPGEKGATYDTQGNPMLKALRVRYEPCRMDRFYARLNQWQVESIELVGKQPIPGLKALVHYRHIPVTISDHYGVLLKLTWPGTVPKGRARNWGKPRG